MNAKKISAISRAVNKPLILCIDTPEVTFQAVQRKFDRGPNPVAFRPWDP